jgi:hypothetical protein
VETPPLENQTKKMKIETQGLVLLAMADCDIVYIATQPWSFWSVAVGVLALASIMVGWFYQFGERGDA